VPTNVQTIKGNDTLIYLGKSELIPYEPKAVSTLDFSYGGGYDFTHRITTEFGTILIDIYTNKIFLLRDGLQDINEGIQSFFDSYLRWDLLNYNIDYRKNNIMLYYDTWRKRLMLTFKNARITNSLFNTSILGKVGSYNQTTDKIEIYSGSIQTANYSIADIGVEETYTLSYSFKRMKWISFHGYFPDYAFNIKKGFVGQYGLDGFTEFYKHVQPTPAYTFPHLLYTGRFQKFIIETTINKNPNTTKVLNALSIFSTSPNWSKMSVYTDKQATGDKTLQIVKAGDNLLASSMYSVLLTQKENYYNINRIFDYVVDSTLPIWATKTPLESIYNLTNIDTTNIHKPYQSAIRGFWIKVRLEHSSALFPSGEQGIYLLEANTTPVNR
jgi:hypothetical protein